MCVYEKLNYVQNYHVVWLHYLFDEWMRDANVRCRKIRYKSTTAVYTHMYVLIMSRSLQGLLRSFQI